MAEYGQAVGHGSGAVSGGGGGGGGSVDVGTAVSNWINDAGRTISTMPTWELAILIVAVIAGLFLVRRLI
jgi:hypothetical protein